MITTLRTAILSIAFAVAPAQAGPAQSETPRGTLYMEFTAPEPADHWKARAVQEAVKSYLTPFANLLLVENRDQADYLLTGEYRDDEVDYSIRDKRTGALIDSGTMDVQDARPASVQIQTLRAVRPLVKTGGLIEMRAHQSAAGTSTGRWLLTILGGCLWAMVLLRLGRFSAGSLAGVQRIDHLNLWPFLRSWLEVTTGKFILGATYLGIVILAARGLTVPRWLDPESFWTFGAPLAGTAGLALLYGLNAIMARALDRSLLKNENRRYWDTKLNRYFSGYARRLGVDLPESLLSGIEFRVSRSESVVTYGGMGLKARIVIPWWLAEPAVGAPPLYQPMDPNKNFVTNQEPAPHAHWELRSVIWPQALRAPGGIKARVANPVVDPPPAVTDSPQESQVRTWGFILPSPEGESVPLISNHQEDLDVVDELVNAHHIHFAKPQIQEEFDDTDPQHKDFLFGLMMREIGRVHRRETLLTGLGYLLSRVYLRLPSPLDRPLEWIKSAYLRHYSKFPALLADSYAVLNHAGHHLVQTVYFQATRRESVLTSRTSVKTMATRTREIFEDIAARGESDEDRRRYHATYRNRLIWLADHFHLAPADARPAKRWPWKRALAGLATIAAVAIEGYAAYRFHPEYVERMNATKKKIEEFEKQKGKENGKG